jgi:hypothetical protein
MDLESFSEVSIFRPRAVSELALRTGAEAHLRAKYRVGRYSDPAIINEILKYQFAYYEDILAQLLPPIASRQLLHFLLFQYDQTAEIDRIYKGGKLTAREEKRWISLGAQLRRALKYLIERIVLLKPEDEPELSEDYLLSYLDRVMICAEVLVQLYVMSEQTFAIVPSGTIFEIFPPGRRLYFALNIKKRDLLRFGTRVRIDSANRDRFVPLKSPAVDVDLHDKYLGVALKDSLGVTFTEAISVLRLIIEEAQTADDELPTLFLDQDRTASSISSGWGLPDRGVRAILNGFTISKEKMEEEGREIWRPKQEYRAFRRGFFEVSHPSGMHLAFSREMARECLMQLLSGVGFKQLPPEWRTAQVNRGLESLSNEVGKWFESIVQTNLSRNGITGVRSLKDQIGSGDRLIRIPDPVGELDFLGYSSRENLLVLVECKMTYEGTEPRYFRDAMSSYVTSRNAHATKFRRKLAWVQENANAISLALASVLPLKQPITPARLAAAMITYYPSAATYFIDDFPCASITEFMLAYESTGKWPYPTHVL